MKVILVNDVKYGVYPIYENYAASKSGKAINVKRQLLTNGDSINKMIHVGKKLRNIY